MSPLFTGDSSTTLFESLQEICPKTPVLSEVSVVSPFFDPPEQANLPAEAVWSFAEPRGIDMPITEAVTRLVRGEKGIQELLGELMARPSSGDAPWSSRSIARE